MAKLIYVQVHAHVSHPLSQSLEAPIVIRHFIHVCLLSWRPISVFLVKANNVSLRSLITSSPIPSHFPTQAAPALSHHLASILKSFNIDGKTPPLPQTGTSLTLLLNRLPFHPGLLALLQLPIPTQPNLGSSCKLPSSSFLPLKLECARCPAQSGLSLRINSITWLSSYQATHIHGEASPLTLIRQID